MEYVTLRVRKETQRQLKLVAAMTDASMLETLDRLVAAELQRLQRKIATPDDQGAQDQTASHP